MSNHTPDIATPRWKTSFGHLFEMSASLPYCCSHFKLDVQSVSFVLSEQYHLMFCYTLHHKTCHVWWSGSCVGRGPTECAVAIEGVYMLFVKQH